MSQETMLTLNTQTLIGFTEKRGKAWHYSEELQGEESNHYTGAIPIADVERRLFHWSPVESPVYVERTSGPDDELHKADLTERLFVVEDKKAILRSDNGHVMGIFSNNYVAHDYREWLLETVGLILDDTLSIGSAGVLKSGGVAFVSVEVPENVVTPEGVEFRPNLLAVTSFDGSIATTYKRVITNVVCDNTMAAGLGERGQQYKIKHTKNSAAKLQDARDALAIIHSVSDDFAAEVAELTAIKVTPKQFDAFLAEHYPIPEEGKGKTLALGRHEELRQLYNGDERVAPWKGNAYGVLQAVNTYNQHGTTLRPRGTDKLLSEHQLRYERRIMSAIQGSVDSADRTAVNTLLAVIA